MIPALVPDLAVIQCVTVTTPAIGREVIPIASSRHPSPSISCLYFPLLPGLGPATTGTLLPGVVTRTIRAPIRSPEDPMNKSHIHLATDSRSGMEGAGSTSARAVPAPILDSPPPLTQPIPLGQEL